MAKDGRGTTVKVTVAQTGGEIQELAVTNGTPVIEVLEMAGITPSEDEVITRDGAVISPDTPVSGGNIIFVEANDDNG